MQKKYLIIVLVIVIFLILVGCSTPITEQKNESEDPFWNVSGIEVLPDGTVVNVHELGTGKATVNP
jgi:hypothetical protein